MGPLASRRGSVFEPPSPTRRSDSERTEARGGFAATPGAFRGLDACLLRSIWRSICICESPGHVKRYKSPGARRPDRKARRASLLGMNER